MYAAIRLENIISIDTNLFFNAFYKGPNFASISKIGASQYIIYLYSWKFLEKNWFKSVI